VRIMDRYASSMLIHSKTYCDIPEVVLDGETGFLVPERNIDTLSEKLEFLISLPPI